MGDYDSHINIDPIVESRDGYYIIKEVEIEHSKLGKLETPFKIIDGKNINEESANEVKKIIKKPIFESWNHVYQRRNFDALYNIIENPTQDHTKDQIRELDTLFRLKKRMWKDSFTTVSLVFQRNPFQVNKFDGGTSQPLTDDGYKFLLDYIHSASSAFALVPDIIMSESFNLDNYIKYVDDAVSILSDFNSKPIFVPVPIKLTSDGFEKLIKNYRYKGYTNLWVNFNASQISSTQYTRVRFLLRNVRKHLHIENTALYFSHICKEVNRHILDKQTVASNAMAPFFGSDFLGINREPRGGGEMDEEAEKNYLAKNKFKNKRELEKARLVNRTRIFDPSSYYYVNANLYSNNLPIPSINNHTTVDHINRLINSIILNKEMDNARKQIEGHKLVKEYTKNKAAFKDKPDILDNILQGQENQSKLQEWFGNYKIKIDKK